MNGHGNKIDKRSLSFNSSIVRLNDPSEEGYIFINWYEDSALRT